MKTQEYLFLSLYLRKTSAFLIPFMLTDPFEMLQTGPLNEATLNFWKFLKRKSTQSRLCGSLSHTPTWFNLQAKLWCHWWADWETVSHVFGHCCHSCYYHVYTANVSKRLIDLQCGRDIKVLTLSLMQNIFFTTYRDAEASGKESFTLFGTDWCRQRPLPTLRCLTQKDQTWQCQQ